MIHLEKYVSLGWLDQHLESVGIFAAWVSCGWDVQNAVLYVPWILKFQFPVQLFYMQTLILQILLELVKRGALGEFLEA